MFLIKQSPALKFKIINVTAIIITLLREKLFIFYQIMVITCQTVEICKTIFKHACIDWLNNVFDISNIVFYCNSIMLPKLVNQSINLNFKIVSPFTNISW